MEKRTLLRRVAPGEELEDIPDGFDSREVLIGRTNPSPIFVIKANDQVLPYCVINFTRGLVPGAPNRPARLMSPSPASSFGVNSTTTLQNSNSGPPGAQPMAGSTIAGASASFTTMRIPVPVFAPPSSSGPSAAGSSTAGSSSPPWPPVSVFFLAGKHCNAAENAANGTMTVTLGDKANFQLPHLKQRMEKNLHALVGLQIFVIIQLRSRPDLISNERLKKMFCSLQHSDVIICLPTQFISRAVAEVKAML